MLKITDVPGIEVGHATHSREATGCTVILCRQGAVAGVDVRGSAPGTRETDLLRPGFLIQRVHAVVLTGGSAFGLRTADGVMQYLWEQHIGYSARGIIVPIVPAAVIFDLRGERNPLIPDAAMGYRACQAASTAVEEGLVGAGRGATVGKILGLEHAMAGGLGSVATELPDGTRLGALCVVNSLGDIIDPNSGRIVAGAREPDGEGFADTLRCMMEGRLGTPLSSTHTTLAVVATNARLTKEQVNKLAQMAQNGIARVTRPAHTMYDGDVVFALSTGDHTADINLLGETAAQMVSQAILRAVTLSNAHNPNG